MTRSGAPAGTLGHFHEAALFGTDDEFVSIVAPFIIEGVDNAEPVVVVCSDRNRLLLDAVVDPETFVFVAQHSRYTYPAATIAAYQRMLEELVDAGAAQIRLVGEVPHPASGRRWDQWARYESAINETLNAYPLWAICPYDTRLTSESMLRDIVASHRYLAAGGRHVANPEYAEPIDHLRSRVRIDETLDEGPADVELVDPTPRRARQVVGQMCEGTTLTPTQIADLTLAVSETLANAVLYGVRPIRLLVWREARGCVVRICDGGYGPLDPFAGLRPVVNPDGLGGLGLWIAHQLCEVDILGTPDGATVRLSLRN